MKMSLTLKYLTTFALFFCYFVYGVNFYVVGPTLIELAGLFQTTIEKICLIYTVRSAGYTLGSLSGFLFNYINRQLAFIFFLTLMGITLILMPHCSSLMQLFTMAAINGFSIGSFDTAINVWLLEMWGEASGPYMQALHFTYGLGSFVAPLICEPFLSQESIYVDHGHHLKSTSMSLNTTTNIFSANNTTDSILNSTDYIINNVIDPIDYLIYIPYAFAGGITIAGAATVLMLYAYKKYEPPTKANNLYAITPNEEKQPENNGLLVNRLPKENKSQMKSYIESHIPPCITIWLVTMGSLFLTFFVGMEQMHLQFLPTFAVNSDLNLSPSEAALISSATAAAFTIGRGLSIPLAIKLRPQTILYTNHILMFLGTIILAFYANSSEVLMWIGNIILGAGFSSVYASIYAFLEQQIRVTNVIGSIFVFAGGLTAALSPSIVGHYIEANPLILIWFNLVCAAFCFGILIIIHLTVSIKNRTSQSSVHSKADNEVKIVVPEKLLNV